MTRRRRCLPSPSAIVVALLLLFLFAPLLAVVVLAFNSGSSMSFPLEGLSLRWFSEILGDPAFTAALLNSIKVAAVTAVAACVVGVPAAMVITRRPSRATAGLEVASRVPVMLPPLLIGVALLAAIDAFRIVPSLVTVALGHLLYVVPFVVAIVLARFRSLDVEVEQAARDLGAGSWETARRITLPLIAPAVLGAAAVAFAFSFDETLITTFTSGRDSTLPLYVLSSLRRTIDPSINAVAVVMLLIPWVALGVSLVVLRRPMSGVARRTGKGTS